MRIKVALGIAMALTLVAGLAYAQTTGPGASGGSELRTLHFKVRTVAVNQNDVAPTGTSIGDQLTSWSQLLKNGAVAGHTAGSCTFTGSRAMCTAIVVIEHQGQIALQGLLRPAYLSGSGTARFAVTGGTGPYRHASGWASVEQTGGPTQNLTLSLAL